VTIRGRFSVDRPLEVEVPDEATWAEIEVPEYDLKNLTIGLSALSSSVGIDVDTEGVGNTNCVGNLDKDTIAEFSSYEGLGDPPGSIGCTAVDLSWVLSGEGSTTMGTPSSVCVDDDLAAGKTCVTMWATTGEASAWVEMVDGVLVKVLCRDNWGNDLFLQLGLEILEGDIWAVLGGDEDGVDT